MHCSVLLALSLAALALGGDPCVFDGATDVRSKAWYFSPKAQELVVNGSMNVHIKTDEQCDKFSIKVTTQRKVMKWLQVRFNERWCDAGTCQVKIRHHGPCEAPMTVSICMPAELTAVGAYGGSTVAADHVRGSLIARDGSTLGVGALAAEGNNHVGISATNHGKISVKRITKVNQKYIPVVAQEHSHISVQNGFEQVHVPQMPAFIAGGSSVELEMLVLELLPILQSGRLSVSHVHTAYIRADELSEVTISYAETKVVECSIGREMNIQGPAKIVPPGAAWHEAHCGNVRAPAHEALV